MKKLSVVLAALAVSIVGLSGQASATPRPADVCSDLYSDRVPLVTGPSGTGTPEDTPFTAYLSGFYPNWPVSVRLTRNTTEEDLDWETTDGSGEGDLLLTATSKHKHTITATQTLGSSGCTLIDTTTVCIETCNGDGLLSGPSGSRFAGLADILLTAAGRSSMPGTAASSVAFDGVVTSSSDSGLASPLQWTLVAAAGGLGIAGVGTFRRRTRRPAPTA